MFRRGDVRADRGPNAQKDCQAARYDDVESAAVVGLRHPAAGACKRSRRVAAIHELLRRRVW